MLGLETHVERALPAGASKADVLSAILLTMPVVEGAQEFNEMMFGRILKMNNRALDGFLDFFVKSDIDCRKRICGQECRYCYSIADEVMVYDKEYFSALTSSLERRFSSLADGSFFSAEGPRWTDMAQSVFHDECKRFVDLPATEASAKTCSRAPAYLA